MKIYKKIMKIFTKDINFFQCIFNKIIHTYNNLGVFNVLSLLNINLLIFTLR